MIKGSGIKNLASAVQSVNITYVSGLIGKNDIAAFKRILFRSTKGKVLCRICENAVFDDESEQHLPPNKRKCVFVLVFQDLRLLN